MRLLERQLELDALARALDLTSGTGTGIAVCGEPGAGKSALVEVACARARAVRVLRGACDPLATPRPLGPFRDLEVGLGRVDLTESPPAVCGLV